VAFAARSPRAGGGRRGGTQAATADSRPARDPDAAPPREVDPDSRARQICLDQLGHSPRTRAELAAVLAKRGVQDDVAERVLSRFTEVGMIDDALFAQMWVSSRHRGRGLAGRALEQELRRKGVDAAHIDAAVEGLDDDVQLATARALVARRLASTRGLEAPARVRRLAGLLARKGYPAGTAFRVVREALAAEGEPEVDDLLALQDQED
jgi:regulatory protein